MSHPLNTYIDHTLLRPDATEAEVRAVCEETLRYQFASACLLPVWVLYAQTILQGHTLCSVVGFPLGGNTTDVKAFEARQLNERGVREVDMVLAIGALKGKDYDYVLRDIRAVVEAAESSLVKVIIETCLLTDEEKKVAALLCVDAGAHFVKTSTGFSKAGATVHDVALLRETVGPLFGVKASGGIRTAADACAMIQAGATRIGTSAGVSMVTDSSYAF